MSAVPEDLAFFAEDLRQEKLARHRWQHMLGALRRKVHTVGDGPEDAPWREYFQELATLAERSREDPGAHEAAIKRHVAKGFMRLLFEKDAVVQSSGFPEPEGDERVVFRTRRELAEAFGVIEGGR
ncbi:MAG: hypothetical protein HY658_02190 [Actinobacteria bacterium]|nr:hypothetical protein [Actinomycetota bacterium]